MKKPAEAWGSTHEQAHHSGQRPAGRRKRQTVRVSNARDQLPSRSWLIECCGHAEGRDPRDGLRRADLLAPRSITYLSGAPKEYKTWEAMALAICLVTGRSFCGLQVKGKHKILFVEAENRFQIPGRFEKLCRGLQVNPQTALERIKFCIPAPRHPAE